MVDGSRRTAKGPPAIEIQSTFLRVEFVIASTALPTRCDHAKEHSPTNSESIEFGRELGNYIMEGGD